MLEPAVKIYKTPWNERIMFGDTIHGANQLRYTYLSREEFVNFEFCVVPRFVITDADCLIAVLIDGTVLRIEPDKRFGLKIKRLEHD